MPQWIHVFFLCGRYSHVLTAEIDAVEPGMEFSGCHFPPPLEEQIMTIDKRFPITKTLLTVPFIASFCQFYYKLSPISFWLSPFRGHGLAAIMF